MDYSLLALVGLIVVALIIATRYHSRAWPGRPGSEYQRVITITVLGLWLTVAGVIGWDLKHLRGFFQGIEWVEPPIWWQIGAGVTLLALAVYFARRVPYNVPHRPEQAMPRPRP